MTDFSWSYSAYSSAVTCLRKFKYCYVDKIAPDGLDSGDLLFGSALHSAINASLTGQDGSATFELYWNSYKEKEVEYGRFNWSQLAQLGAEFVRKFVKMHAGKYKLEFAEERLYAEYRGIKLEGTPDFFGEYNGKSSLRDFKTSGRNYEQGKSDCALQLYLYAYLCKQSGPKRYPETLGYTVFNKGTGSIQDLTWDFNEDKMFEVLTSLTDYCGGMVMNFHNIFSDGFPRNYNACLDYNRKCQYWDLCHGNKEKK